MKEKEMGMEQAIAEGKGGEKRGGERGGEGREKRGEEGPLAHLPTSRPVPQGNHFNWL